VARIREAVTIGAAPAEVWRVVHEDLAEVPRWAEYLRRVDAVGGHPGQGWRVRYELDLPGGAQTDLVLEYTTWDRPRHAAGRFVEGPLQGTWSYRFQERGAQTDVLYEMDYEMRGLLRLAGGALKGRYAEGIRHGMAMLKRHLEG
jgi:hypothetical protein